MTTVHNPQPAGTPRPVGPLVAIIGGMGPLASAGLLTEVYRIARWTSEQEAPRLLLWSDPAVADRTTAIRDGRLEPLRQAIQHSVTAAETAGAEVVVVACVTAHRVLDEIRTAPDTRLVSLVDTVIAELAAEPGSPVRPRLVGDPRPSRTADGPPMLMLCTSGTAQAGIFTHRPGWETVAPRVVNLSSTDQDALHDLLYRIKRHGCRDADIATVTELVAEYRTAGFVAGCTELHLVANAARPETDLTIVDPLHTVADWIAAGCPD